MMFQSYLPPPRSHADRFPHSRVQVSRAIVQNKIVNQLVDRIHTIQDPYAGTGGGGGGGTNVGVVRGSDGKVINVLAGSGGGTNYPTILRVNTANGDITMDVATVGSEQLKITNPSNGATLIMKVSSIARNMSIQTIQVCASGVTKNMDVIASAPY